MKKEYQVHEKWTVRFVTAGDNIRITKRKNGIVQKEVYVPINAMRKNAVDVLEPLIGSILADQIRKELEY